MQNLIISIDFYSWIRFCAGTIYRDPSNFEVLIICSQNEDPIFRHEVICEEARYEQRKYDLFRIGKELGIKKISNLRFPKNIEDRLEELIIRLQLQIGLGAVRRVYYQDNRILNVIIDKINNSMKYLEVYAFPGNKHIHKKVKDRVELLPHEVEKKRGLCDYMIGISKEEELRFPVLMEKFYE